MRVTKPQNSADHFGVVLRFGSFQKIGLREFFCRVGFLFNGIARSHFLGLRLPPAAKQCRGGQLISWDFGRFLQVGFMVCTWTFVQGTLQDKPLEVICSKQIGAGQRDGHARALRSSCVGICISAGTKSGLFSVGQ